MVTTYSIKIIYTCINDIALLQGNWRTLFHLLVAVNLQISISFSQKMLNGGELFLVETLVFLERQSGHLRKIGGVFRRFCVCCSNAFSIKSEYWVSKSSKLVRAVNTTTGKIQF